MGLRPPAAFVTLCKGLNIEKDAYPYILLIFRSRPCGQLVSLEIVHRQVLNGILQKLFVIYVRLCARPTPTDHSGGEDGAQRNWPGFFPAGGSVSRRGLPAHRAPPPTAASVPAQVGVSSGCHPPPHTVRVGI